MKSFLQIGKERKISSYSNTIYKMVNVLSLFLLKKEIYYANSLERISGEKSAALFR